jgi:hypothetical protein
LDKIQLIHSKNYTIMGLRWKVERKEFQKIGLTMQRAHFLLNSCIAARSYKKYFPLH